MRLARLPFVWRTSAALNVSRYYANCFVKEFRLGEHILKTLYQCQNSTKAGTQPNKNARWIADDDETPSITWPEPISWSQPMTGPGCARGEMFNTADQIQDQLHDDGHCVWGFAVYRCTYGNDATWQTFLERIHASIRRKMEYCHGLDLLEEDCFKLTVLEDASKFDGASVQTVREHFKKWRMHAANVEQGTDEEIGARRAKLERIRGTAEMDMELCTRLTDDVKEAGSKEPRLPFRIASYRNAYGHHYPAVRYTFCVQVDDAALQSIVSPEGEKFYGDAWVNLIEADWDPDEAARQREEDRVEHSEDGGDLEDFEQCVEVFPELDGCIEENVGWMRVQYRALIPEFYSHLQHPNILDRMYYRPPEIGGKY